MLHGNGDAGVIGKREYTRAREQEGALGKLQRIHLQWKPAGQRPWWQLREQRGYKKEGEKTIMWGMFPSPACLPGAAWNLKSDE